jgi:hypothetical protein
MTNTAPKLRCFIELAQPKHQYNHSNYVKGVNTVTV